MNDETAIIRRDEQPLALAGQAADRAAARGVFAAYQADLAKNTLRSQRADLVLLARYQASAGILPAYPEERVERQEWEERHAAPFWSTPEAWRGMTWGLVAGFKVWLSQEGHAVASINRALATLRRYAELARQAGAIDADALQLIRTVKGYRNARKVDEKRETSRVGHKKAHNVSISPEAAHKLKSQPEMPQGARDGLLMALLLDHGLRVSEVALLQWKDIDAEGQHLTFFRPKVDKTQVLRLSPATRRALERWRQYVTFYEGPLLRAVNKGGQVLDHGMTTSAIAQRVSQLGAAAGLAGLSPHDCRHYWATVLTRKGTSIKALQDAGGWSSPAMPLRYAESARIANEGAEVD